MRFFGHKNKALIGGTALGCLLVFLAVSPALAQGSPDLGLEYATATGLGTTDVRTTIATIINAFLGLLGIIAVGIILYAGFLWMTAGGNEEKVTTAKKWMVNGIIGLVIILSAFAIASFVLKAIVKGTGGDIGTGGCEPGRSCGSVGGGTGGGGGFVVQSIMPEGPGPGGNGFPKNSSIRVKFSGAVDPSSLESASAYEVFRCNPRDEDFNEGDCTTPVAVTATVDSSLVTLTSETACEERPDIKCLDGEYWHMVKLFSAITSTANRPLTCPGFTAGSDGEFWSAASRNDLCDRAFATNNSIDTEPPTVSISIPKSPPGYCDNTINVQAIVKDDSFPTVARFSLRDSDGQEVFAFIDKFNGDLHDGIVANTEEPDSTPKEFSADELAIDSSKLVAGETYTLVVVAEDTVPNVSGPVEKSVILNPLHCCNGELDDPPETKIDCGVDSDCGLCNGDSCEADAECATGSCVDGQCVERPEITAVDPIAGGPGTLVTLTGKYFGEPGGVVFLGGPGTDDDVQAQACAAQAWERGDDGVYTVTVSVPQGAVSGPLQLTSDRGLSDDTTADTAGVVVDPFEVTTAPPPPGICYLSPNTGTAISSFVINGIGFGADGQHSSYVQMGTNGVAIQSGGWSDEAINAFVPSTREGIYPVTVTVKDDPDAVEKVTNAISFSVRPEAGEAIPTIDEIIPAQGPPGAYITLVGSGFGNNGTVTFTYDVPGFAENEVAYGDTPACADNWKKNYIIIKVPERYESQDSGSELGTVVNRLGVDGSSGVHSVQVETATAIPKKSNTKDFVIDTSEVKPGICSITPDNGPPGTSVQLTGERFGSGPASTVDLDADPVTISAPRNTLDFHVSGSLGGGDLVSMAAAYYKSWGERTVTANVPGKKSDLSTWPATGNVYLRSNGARSSNAVPFLVQDCNEGGCDADAVCCANGSCEVPEAGKPACQPKSRDSAYAWRLSTMTLPDLPRVIERSCTIDGVQSPAPARASRDACVNSFLQVLFNTKMDKDTIDLSTFVVQNCGTEEDSACPADLVTDLVGGTIDIPPGETVARFAASPMLSPNTWYRVTLVSQPLEDVGIRSIGVSAAYLDGDKDNRPGGNYTYTFRTRNNAQICKVDRVFVEQPEYTIDHQWDPRTIHGTDEDGFLAVLAAANCNPIQCSVAIPDTDPTQYDDLYTIEWFTDEQGSPTVLELDDPQGGACLDLMSVVAASETAPGSSITLTASAYENGGVLSDAKDGDSSIKVKFADPYVEYYAPSCEEACVNTGASVGFNVSMDPSKFASNLEIIKCRNASCNPPFVASEQPTVSHIDNDVRGEAPFDYVYGFSAFVTGGFDPDSYYLVRVKGGDDGMLSASGVALTRLNDSDANGEYFSWIFKTRNDGNPCQVSSADIKPSKAEFKYVGDRRGLQVIPRGAPDECDARGQVLDPYAYPWQWATPTNPGEVVAGFIDPYLFRPGSHLYDISRLDTAASLVPGCDASCRLVGSQNTLSQCGNGTIETGEQCENNLFGLYPDLGAGEWPAQCDTTSCLWKGTVSECGNGVLDRGETCEAVGGTFPEGCLEPSGERTGCIATGATEVPGTVCGDGAIGDGEDCDDGNKANGDGCSDICLMEGTLRSCLDVTSGACVNFCGNGRAEPGEDADCETATGVASFCDRVTCLKKGTNPSVGGAAGCGDGVLQSGEECDPGPEGAEWCTNRCLYAGASWKYEEPSFCGDGIYGYGEHPQCDGTEKFINSPEIPIPDPSPTPDGNTDPFQVAVAGSFSGENGETALVTAGLVGLAPDRQGESVLSLSCVCDEQGGPAAAQQYCYEIDPSRNLGCDKNGCCAPAPNTVDPYYPRDNSTNQCRNTGIRILFDQNMDGGSAKSIRLLFLEPEAGACEGLGLDSMQLAYDPAIGASHPAENWFMRAIHGVTDFIRRLFGSAVRAQASSETYCIAETTVSVSDKTVRLAPTKALLPGTWYTVFIPGAEDVSEGVKAISTVPLAESQTFQFQTGADICVIDSVSVTPSSYLFTVAEDLGTDNAADANDGDQDFTAEAHPSGGAEDAFIVSTEEYAFKWHWHKQIDDPVSIASSFVVEPTIASIDEKNQFCEIGEVGSDCSVDLEAAEDPKPPPGCGNDLCEANTDETPATCEEDCAVEPGHEATATVRIQDAPEPDFPRNGESIIRVTADIADGMFKSYVAGEADVVAMLCDNPWPKRRVCDEQQPDGSYGVTLPWAENEVQACQQGELVWFPFWDGGTDQRAGTDMMFYYCRDGGAGDGAATLPELSEDIVRIEHDTATTGLLREYLFTFVTDGPWRSDAIGVRFATNFSHLGIADWYKERGFRGSPAPVEIGGYQALQDGRTAYVNAAAVTDNGIFTNVNVLSFTDGSQPETIAIFNQILQNIDFNRSVKDLGYCTDQSGNQVLLDDEGSLSPSGSPVACAADVDCRKFTDGTFLPGLSSSYFCRNPEAKLARDVLRIGEALKARENLLTLGEGSYPALRSGTFLPGRTTSAWASWNSVLSEEAAQLLPTDPINRFGQCSSGFSQDTCWNQDDQEYMCPKASQVFEYQALGGADFILLGSLESVCDGLPALLCEETPGCTFAGGNIAGGPIPESQGGQWMPNYLCDVWGDCTYDTAFVRACQIWGALFPECIGSFDPAYLGSFGFCNGVNYPYLCPAYYIAGQSGCQISGETWKGGTCLDKGVAECTGECEVVDGRCDFKDGRLRISGTPAYPGLMCDGGTIIGGGTASCGDGILTYPEQCEPGDTSPVTCPVQGGYQPTTTKRCGELCTWASGSQDACVYGTCDDGVVQPEEDCDDGQLNGTYGYCGDDCHSVAAYCGNGSKQPVEACDCGVNNGAYKFNAILATAVTPNCAPNGANAASCSWDCGGVGPRCGDGIINNTEDCDGGVQTAKGYCNDAAKSPCDTNADCPTGNVCGNFCGDPNDPLDPRRNQRACKTNDTSTTSDDATACRWQPWSCTAAGSCGNGVLETGEECDEVETDGPNGDAGECVMHTGVYECKLNRCGDGYVYGVAGEECDEGPENGQVCIPSYDRSCTYCTESCKVRSASGGFCGNGLLEGPSATPPGPEECDGTFGFAGNWICRSDRKEHHSWGLYTGQALCSASSCQIDCADVFSVPCLNDAVTTNTDASSGSNPDSRVNYSNAFYDGEDLMRTGPTQVPLSNACDPDDDGDGVPDNARAECDSLDPNVHGAYSYNYTGVDPETGQPLASSKSITIPAIPEACDCKDNDCDGSTDIGPGLYQVVDMMFAIDITGSMGSIIQNVVNGISRFANEYSNAPHRFGFVTYGQNSGDCGSGFCYAGRIEANLLTVNSFLNVIGDSTPGGGYQGNNYDPPYPHGGIEAGWDALYGLIDSSNPFSVGAECSGDTNACATATQCTGATNYCTDATGADIAWRGANAYGGRDAYPFVIIVTDACPSSSIDPGSATMSRTGKTASGLKTLVSNCALPGCTGANDFVEMFVMSDSNCEGDWSTILQGTPQTGPINRSERFFPFHNATTGVYATEDQVYNFLRNTVFRNICPFCN